MNSTNDIESFSVHDRYLVKKDLFSNIWISITAFLFLFLLVFTYFSLNYKLGFAFVACIGLSLILSISIFLALTKKHWRDLKFQKVEISTSRIDEKVHKIDYEAGSVTVPVNFISLLFFKKIFMRKMNKLDFFYISVNQTILILFEEDFNRLNIGDEISLRWSQQAKVFLGLVKENKLIEVSPFQADRIIYV